MVCDEYEINSYTSFYWVSEYKQLFLMHRVASLYTARYRRLIIIHEIHDHNKFGLMHRIDDWYMIVMREMHD